MPELVDNSGALSARFIVLHAAISFLGREDLGLLDRLMLELPGILNWALEGWRRLSECGHFVQPESARDIIDEIEDAARPVATFVREKCKVGDPQFHSVKRADLYNAWRGWCTDQGRDHPGSAATFGKRLRVVVPSVTSRRPRKPGSPDINVDDRRQRYYYGVSLG